jgi:uncharacterized protein (TIRG00374 family)
MQKNETQFYDIESTQKIRSAADYEKRVRTVRHAIMLLLGISFIIFIAIAAFAVVKSGVGNFIRAFHSIEPLYYIAATLVLFLGYMIRFPKWEMYMKRLGIKINRRKNLAIYLSMYSMDITPGRWGRSIVAYTINKLTGAKFSATFPAIVVDIFTDFLGFVVMLTIATVLVKGYYVITAILIVLLLIPFVFFYSSTLFNIVQGKLRRVKRLKGFFRAARLYFKNHKRMGVDVYAYSMVFTIPAMFTNGLALYLVILSFGVHIGLMYLPAVLFIFYFTLLLGMVTGVPGALGVTDVAMATSLTLFFQSLPASYDITSATALGLASVVTIFYRIISIWFVQGFGSAALTYTFKYWKS